MDELVLPLAAVAAVTALVAPARRRVVPVAKAVGRAGLAVGGATVVGGRGIVEAAVRGESRRSETKTASTPAASRGGRRSSSS
jgi:hypothetical protein